MKYFLRRRALSRRTFLRGAGCALALPWLDAMVPALRRPAPTLRAVFVFVPNGKKMDEWRPKSEGAGFALPASLRPLAAHRKRMRVLTGLDLDGGNAHGDGPGDHARAAASFLTAAHPFKTGGEDIRNGISVDQVLAQALGDQTRFPSLEVGMERGQRSGSCDSGYACAYSANIAWSSPTTPVAKETNPRALFERLFGDPDAILDEKSAQAQARRRRSVLDVVSADARDLSRKLGPSDRAKLGEFLDSVRTFEKRLAASEDEPREQVAVPAGLRQAARGFGARLALMYELLVLALTTDSTRVITFMTGNAGSNRSYGELDVADGHHSLSHHRSDPEKLAKIAKIDRFHSEQFAGFLDRFAATPDGDGDLLDQSLVLFGSAIADGNAHRHTDLPIALFGTGGGVRSGRHTRSKPGTPLANLYLSMLHRMGVPTESFGDSTGALL